MSSSQNSSNRDSKSDSKSNIGNLDKQDKLHASQKDSGSRDSSNRSQQNQASANQNQQGTSQRGFAGMDPTQQREIAREGGRAAHQAGTAHEFTSEEARRAGHLSHKSEARHENDDEDENRISSHKNASKEVDSSYAGTQHKSGNNHSPRSSTTAGRHH